MQLLRGLVKTVQPTTMEQPKVQSQVGPVQPFCVMGAAPPAICWVEDGVSVASVWRWSVSLRAFAFFMAMCFAKVNKKRIYKKAGLRTTRLVKIVHYRPPGRVKSEPHPKVMPHPAVMHPVVAHANVT